VSFVSFVSFVVKLFHHNPPVPQLSRFLPEESDTLAFGAELAPCLKGGMVVYLQGELGAGKTTLARGVLRGLGYAGRVKSPSYALVEPYTISRLYLYHFDFYRFNDPRELTEAGFREYFNPDSVCLVEWPENAAGRIPSADLTIEITAAGTGRQVTVGSGTEAGNLCIESLRQP
jgi:tRNA threonylcarbamoyladenosine biosynthesis protein TsaE